MQSSSFLHAIYFLALSGPLLLVQGQGCGVNANLVTASWCSSLSSSAVTPSSVPYSLSLYSNAASVAPSSVVARFPLSSIAPSSTCVFSAIYSTGAAVSSSTGVGVGVYWGTSSSSFPSVVGYNYDQVFSSKSLTFVFTGTSSSLMYLAIVMFNSPSTSSLKNITVICGTTVSTYPTCPPGSYSVSSSCAYCPIGKYNPFSTNAPSCLSCGSSLTTTFTGASNYYSCTSANVNTITTSFYNVIKVVVILFISVGLLVTVCCSCCCLCCLSPKSHSPFTQTITYRYERRWHANIAVWFAIAVAIGSCFTSFTSPLFRSISCFTSTSSSGSSCFIADYYHNYRTVWLDTSSSSSSVSYSTTSSNYADNGLQACKEGGQALVALMSISLCFLVAVSLLSFIRFFYWSVPLVSGETAVKFEWPILVFSTVLHVIGTIVWGSTCERYVSNNMSSDSFVLPSGHIYLITADIMLLTACWLDFMIRQSKEWQCKDIRLICPNLPAANNAVVVPAVAMPAVAMPLYQPPPQQYQQLQHSAPVVPASPQYMMYAPQPAYPQVQYGQPMQPQPQQPYYASAPYVPTQLAQHPHQHQLQQLQQQPAQYHPPTYATLSTQQWQAARPSVQSSPDAATLTATTTAPLLSSPDSAAASTEAMPWSTSSTVLGEGGAAYAAPSAPDRVEGER